jgi:hypothetical protein
MIYKYTSVKTVIAKVFSDFDLKEGDHRISDMISWVGEGLEKIGAFPQFITKVTGKDDNPILVFSNYQCKLPADFHRLIQIAYCQSPTGPYYPMRYATGSFEYNSSVNEPAPTDVDGDGITESTLVNLAMDLYGLDYNQALTKINNEPAIRSLLVSLIKDKTSTVETTSSDTGDLIYVIVDNYIKTNIASGYLMMSYQAIPTDIDGYPLVPDEVSFLEALYWYVVKKLLYPMWRDGRVRDAVYNDAKSSWNYYCKQAYGNAMMPNQDQLESFKNSWLRLIPEINEHKSFFSNLGQEQIIYNANK